VNNDVFTLYWPGRTLRNLVIWKQMNQAVFQLGYGYPQEVTDILAETIEIIRDETETQNGHRGIIVLCASKSCRFKNVRFEDVSINGVRLRSEKDFPNGLETQGDVRLEFR
jgi:hypothetical protein